MLHPHYYLKLMAARLTGMMRRVLGGLSWATEHKEFEANVGRRLEESRKERVQLAYDINLLHLRVMQRSSP